MAKKRLSQDYKILWVLMFILIICFVIMGFLFYRYFYAGTGTSKYGDRLIDIGDYPLDKTKLLNDIKDCYSSEKAVEKININVQGRIIYITIDLNDLLKETIAKSLAAKSLECIDEKNLGYYEVQFIVTYSGSEENEVYPLFGTKNANSLKVVW